MREKCSLVLTTVTREKNNVICMYNDFSLNKKICNDYSKVTVRTTTCKID